MTIVTTNDETFGVGLNALDVETFTRRSTQKHSELTTALEKHDLTLVGTDNEFTIWKPSVAGIIVRNLGIFLGNCTNGLLQSVLILYLEEFVGLVTCDQNTILIEIMERDLSGTEISGNALNVLEGKDLCLVPGLNDDLSGWLAC